MTAPDSTASQADQPEDGSGRDPSAPIVSDLPKPGANARTPSSHEHGSAEPEPCHPSDPGHTAEPPADLDLFGHAPRGRRDWSHRRGEPRVFALLWTLFLTVLATTTLMRAAIGGRLDLWVYRDALRSMLMVVVTAIVVGWPLLRLSQARPRGSGCAATIKDVLIVLVPLQAVIWPQAILARWPITVIAAASMLMAAWTLMCGGLVALALGPRTEDPDGLPDAEIRRPDPARGRVAAMTAIVGLGAIGGALSFVLDAALRPSASERDPGAWWAMLSPHTGLAELTRDRAAFGESARAEPALLWTLLAQILLGVLFWLIALVREAMARRPDPDDAPPAHPGPPG